MIAYTNGGAVWQHSCAPRISTGGNYWHNFLIQCWCKCDASLWLFNSHRESIYAGSHKHAQKHKIVIMQATPSIKHAAMYPSCRVLTFKVCNGQIPERVLTSLLTLLPAMTCLTLSRVCLQRNTGEMVGGWLAAGLSLLLVSNSGSEGLLEKKVCDLNTLVGACMETHTHILLRPTGL